MNEARELGESEEQCATQIFEGMTMIFKDSDKGVSLVKMSGEGQEGMSSMYNGDFCGE